MIKIFCSTIILLCACTNKTSNCDLRYAKFNNDFFKIKGCLIDSLEDGDWIIYDTSNRVVEYGAFDMGLRNGQWHYRNSQLGIINWIRYTKKSLGLLTNIPNSFDIIADSGYYIKMKSSNQKGLLNIVISVQEIAGEPIVLDSFFRDAQNEFSKNGWGYDFQGSKILSNNNEYYFTWYKIGNQTKSDSNEILNIYSSLNKKLVQITCTYEKRNEQFARVLFTSIISNLFIDSKRLLNPFIEVKKISQLK